MLDVSLVARPLLRHYLSGCQVEVIQVQAEESLINLDLNKLLILLHIAYSQYYTPPSYSVLSFHSINQVL